MMVVAAEGTRHHHRQNPNPTRPPLLPSENGPSKQNPNPKKPFKSKPVQSRYMLSSPSPSSTTTATTSSSSSSSSSFTTPRRCPSPLISRNSTSVPKTRSVSVDRRRPGPGSGPTAADVSKQLFTATRSLSVSFQGEAFSLPISRTKAAPPTPAPVRRGTPERRRPGTPQTESGSKRVVEQQRWPTARNRQSNSNPNPNSRNSLSLESNFDNCNVIGSSSGNEKLGVVDLGNSARKNEQHLWPARTRVSNPSPGPNFENSELSSNFGDNNVIGSISDDEKLSFVSPCQLLSTFDNSVVDEKKKKPNAVASIGDGIKLGLNLDNTELLKSIRRYPDGISNESLFLSDSDSVSSGSSNSARSVGSAKFWQDTGNRTPLTKISSKMVIPPRFGQPKKFPFENPISSPRAMSSSPMRGGNIRSSSPSRLRSSVESLPSRGMPSPSKVRSSISNSFSETPSVLSYAVDVKRGKVGENQIMDAHVLRLLYNRQLQWRFVNARKEAVLLAQRRSVQKNLWNAWITISNLRDSVTKKTHLLHLLRQKLKLASILKSQMIYLEDWASLDNDHCTSLLGSIEALKGSTLRLPVVGGASADLQSIKDAISSAVDVMQAMGSSICSSLSKVEEVNSMVAELTKEIAKEQGLLKQCEGFLTMLAALQVKHCSLRTHILQVNRLPIA